MTALAQIESYEVRLLYPKWLWPSLSGRHFKNKTSKKKKKKKPKPTEDKKSHFPLIYIIQSAILNHTFHFQNETKPVNTKVGRSQLVYIQKIYKLVIFRLLPQTNAHLSLQSTTGLNQSSLQETTGHGFTKSKITAQN